MPNYLENSKQIKEQADRFLIDHRILKTLEKFGKIHFNGSYELDLMNRHDIDVVLIVDVLSFEVVSEINNELNKIGFNKFWVFDNSQKGWSDDPKHIVTEASFGYYNKHIKDEEKWDLGISVCEVSELENALALTRKVKESISKDVQLKEIIVNLKFSLANKYGEHTYRGKAVYDAVLDHGAKTIEEVVALDTNNY